MFTQRNGRSKANNRGSFFIMSKKEMIKLKKLVASLPHDRKDLLNNNLRGSKDMKTIAGIEMYSVEDLMEELGLSKYTVRQYLKDGSLKGRKIGIRWYVSEDNLQTFLNKSQAEVNIDKMFS